ncbi:DUF4174 domain-containing protein [Neorhizobium sp. T786]|uniref:DUF4174 domain-containing protein n=1 Tax=Pseudorhizobium xiangyangii TaxID=2883104 RepID=UPI001CFFC6C3|nr:DUF4174 domain-containing protein [Neorhizobium xiangyangii]MCB5203737.1 DUF4174 domain-containing protein [Neorhizobium xiangyangii]
MALHSLMAEITGGLPVTDDAADGVPHKRLVVIFEDTLGALRAWQNELLKINSARLRSMDICVACIPNDGCGPLLNGRPAALPVADLKLQFQGTDTGKFEVLLVDYDGSIMLRSDGPVTIEQLQDAVTGLGNADEQSERQTP